MVTVSLMLVVVAFVCTIASAVGRCPVWVPVLLLTLVHLLGAFPR